MVVHRKKRIYSLIALSGLALESSTFEDTETVGELLITALATNNLRVICKAVDECISRHSSVSRVAAAAKIDRTTLYRAFRLRRGPSLDTLVQVLRVLGYQLVVRDEKTARVFSNRGRARQFTKAFQSQNTELLGEVFGIAFREQGNLTAFARKVSMSRELLYRLFNGPQSPRFGTLLTYLSALDLRFSVVPI